MSLVFLLVFSLLSFIVPILADSPGPWLPRQTATLDPNEFPPQCQNECANIINTVTACGNSLACSCTTSNDNLLQTCVDCVVAGNYTIRRQAEGDAFLTKFYNDCKRAGHPVPHLAVSISVQPGPSATSTDATSASTSASSTTPTAAATRDVRVGMSGLTILFAASGAVAAWVSLVI